MQQAVLDFTEEVTLKVRASDAALEAVREHLSDRQVLDLIMLIGPYMTVCRLLETTGVEPDPVPPSRMGIVLPGQSKNCCNYSELIPTPHEEFARCRCTV